MIAHDRHFDFFFKLVPPVCHSCAVTALFKVILQCPETYRTQLGLVFAAVTTVFTVLSTMSTLHLYYILSTLCVVHLTYLMSVTCQNVLGSFGRWSLGMRLYRLVASAVPGFFTSVL